MRSRKIFSVLVILLHLAGVTRAQNNNDLQIWYKQEASKWLDALPIGNGRMGAMIYGGVGHEHIQFNEQSLWSGDDNWDGAYKTDDHGFGSYRNFGELEITFNGQQAAQNYSRSLDLSTGIHKTSFTKQGVNYSREAFASYPDQVMVFTFKTDKKGALSGQLSLASAQGAKSIATAGSLSFSGEMPNNLKYAAILTCKHDGGSIKVKGDDLVFENCKSLTIFLDARTNYKADNNAGWRGGDPLPTIKKEMTAAENKPYEKLKSAHIQDFRRLAARATINIGSTDKATLALPTNERLKQYAAGGVDPDLEETVFQYGRYLLISCSRPGGLPANLQGLWNNTNTPPWASDYHNNINIQMNYWAAETTGLSECHIPLIDFIVAAQEPCRIATRKAFGQNVRGWTARTSQSIFGGNGWEWNIPASAWYAHHVFEHWDFIRDNEYLSKTAYPVIKEVCEYWEDRLKQMPDGTLMVPKGWSPEHGPREDGVAMDQQIVWDLFQNYLEAAKALNIDTSYQRKIATMQAHLAPNKIGKWGQLQEWQQDRDDPNDEHRHTSHLFAVYPGRQISSAKTPDLASAAIISLRSRSGNYGKNMDKPFTVESTVGDSRQSWTWPWRCALWARLGEGERAGIMIRGLLTYNMISNLFCSDPPFQLDGNFGIPAAMTEMLMQSNTGEVDLLPAIPKAWAVKGAFTGLCARGALVVDCTWRNGKVISYKIRSSRSCKIKVRVNGEVKEVSVTGIVKKEV